MHRFCNDEYRYRAQLNSKRRNMDRKYRRDDRLVSTYHLNFETSVSFIHHNEVVNRTFHSSGHRALHLAVIGAKLLLPHFYNGSKPSFSYYSGCSTGGRQGWSEVQRYPDDFNGVLVGAPANWMTRLPAWDIRVALEQFPNSKASFIPETMWAVIHDAVLAQCDDLDGVLDGLVSDPTRYVTFFILNFGGREIYL